MEAAEEAHDRGDLTFDEETEECLRLVAEMPSRLPLNYRLPREELIAEYSKAAADLRTIRWRDTEWILGPRDRLHIDQSDPTFGSWGPTILEWRNPPELWLKAKETELTEEPLPPEELESTGQI